jgi:hypothetical protein
MIWIQILGAIFALDMMFITYFYHRRGVFYLHDSILWMSVWVGIFLVAMVPQTVEVIIEPFQIIRVMDFLQLAGFFLLFSISFAMFTKSRSNDRKLEKLVREFAVKEAEK